MANKLKVSVFWFRRDLRLEDNHGLSEALKSPYPVLPIFIFDTKIVDVLANDDARISFIHQELTAINSILKKHDSGVFTIKDSPQQAWQKLLDKYEIKSVYFNEDYEPYATSRDKQITSMLQKSGIEVQIIQDHVIFAKNEVLKGNRTPYTMYTPYKNKWRENFTDTKIKHYYSDTFNKFLKQKFNLPSLNQLGFQKSTIKVSNYNLSKLGSYDDARDIPSMDATSYLSAHLRFGTISTRQVVKKALSHQTFLNELIWREFFIQILYHFPKVVHSNFKSKYDLIKWRNNKSEFEKWKSGQTGYPLVDAGMRQLNETGFMHNRVRMVTAGFLCKHLLIDWRWGEAYFAEKLLDYELASNNGNWQWAAGTGCDSAPYFRVFNPTIQVQKFDPKLDYIKKWVPELNSMEYPNPMVDHKMARERAIQSYKDGLALYPQ
jgi:deoxyribodipyrimidine photo-lyase